jgi:hypothetical protein
MTLPQKFGVYLQEKRNFSSPSPFDAGKPFFARRLIFII